MENKNNDEVINSLGMSRKAIYYANLSEEKKAELREKEKLRIEKKRASQSQEEKQAVLDYDALRIRFNQSVIGLTTLF